MLKLPLFIFIIHIAAACFIVYHSTLEMSRRDCLNNEQEEKLGHLLPKAGLSQHYQAFIREKVCSQFNNSIIMGIIYSLHAHDINFNNNYFSHDHSNVYMLPGVG